MAPQEMQLEILFPLPYMEPKKKIETHSWQHLPSVLVCILYLDAFFTPIPSDSNLLVL